MSTLAAPVVGSLVPLASVAMTLMTQVAREGTAGVWIEKPAPPQAVVPAAVVYLSDTAPMVVVVVLDVVVVAIVLVVGAAVDVVVVAAAVDVVVVAAPVVVVAAPVVVVAAPVVVVAAPV